jgi:hypothetical protein
MRQIADRLHRVTNSADPGKLSGRIITADWGGCEMAKPRTKSGRLVQFLSIELQIQISFTSNLV